MATAARTRYATIGEIDVAYQVLGEGPNDLLLMPGSSIPIDCIDLEPSMSRFQRRLATYCRIARYDQRGIGLSSRIPSMDLIGPEYWAEDALAVMDAVGMQQTTVSAPGFASLAALILAARHPARVRQEFGPVERGTIEIADIERADAERLRYRRGLAKRREYC